MKKTFVILLLCLFLILTASAFAVEPSIESYEITAKVPSSYEYLEVKADMKITSPEPLMDFRLCQYFRSTKVKDIKVYFNEEEPLEYTFKENILTVHMPPEENPSSITVSYKIYGAPEEGDKYAGFAFNVSEDDCHINASITRTDNWFPKLKDTGAERLPPFKLNIDVPEDLEVMASGKLYYVAENLGRKVYKWKNYEGITDRSLYFFARKCEKIVKIYDDNFSVILYVPFGSIEENVEFISQVIYNSYRFFEEKFGKTGFNEYKAMATPFGYSGLFNSMTLGEEYFTEEIVHNDMYFPTRSVVHEVSHTWWGNILAFDADKDYWLFEGFAKFSETIALEPVLSAPVEEESFRRMKLLYMVYYGYDKPVAQAGEIEERVLQAPVAYHKGALFLKTLLLLMGEEAFYDGMKEYVKTFRGKTVSTGDFKNIMQGFTSIDLDKLFKDYVEEAPIGEYRVILMGSTENEKGNFVTRFKIENTGGKDIYTEIGVKTYLEDYKKKVYIAEGAAFYLEVLNTEPVSVDVLTVDGPACYLLCEKGSKGPGGFVYITPGGECSFIQLLEKGLFAENNIKNGMNLLEINGKKTSEMGLLDLNRAIVCKAGEKLTLLVEFEENDVREVELLY